MEAFQRSKSTDNVLLSPIPNINYNLTSKSNKRTLERLDNILETPCLFRNMQTTINPITTTNSIGINFKKFSLTNMPTNISKFGSMMSTVGSPKNNNSVTNYISTSSLQGGDPTKYSIPRQKRFEGLHRKASCDSIYNTPEFKSTGVSMAKSIRQSSFIKKDKTPSSQDYVFTSLFDKGVKTKKGISISTKHNIKVINKEKNTESFNK